VGPNRQDPQSRTGWQYVAWVEYLTLEGLGGTREEAVRNLFRALVREDATF